MRISQCFFLVPEFSLLLWLCRNLCFCCCRNSCRNLLDLLFCRCFIFWCVNSRWCVCFFVFTFCWIWFNWFCTIGLTLPLFLCISIVVIVIFIFSYSLIISFPFLNNKRFNLIHSRKKRAEIIIGSNISAIIVEINNEKIAIIARIMKKVKLKLIMV